MGRWFVGVGTLLRGTWLFVGLMLVCVFGVDALLAASLPGLPRHLQIDAEVSEASTKHAEAFRGQDWSR